MAKRERTPSATDDAKKRTRVTKPETFKPIKVASVDAADATDANPPFKQLIQELENTVRNPINGDCILYWMRMTDLRLSDNRALSKAREQAQSDGVPAVVLFVISPQDYIAHDRAHAHVEFGLLLTPPATGSSRRATHSPAHRHAHSSKENT